jgi:hypothetical protein
VKEINSEKYDKIFQIIKEFKNILSTFQSLRMQKRQKERKQSVTYHTNSKKFMHV